MPGNQLKCFSNVWKRFKAAPEVQHLICYGYKVRFLKNTKPPLSPLDRKKDTRLGRPQMEVIREEVNVLCKKGAMQQI